MEEFRLDMDVRIDWVMRRGGGGAREEEKKEGNKRRPKEPREPREKPRDYIAKMTELYRRKEKLRK